MKLAQFVAKRLVIATLLVLAVSVAVFGLLWLAPGDPALILLGARAATPESLAAVRAQYGLDQPVALQYLNWLAAMVRLDFGESIQTREPVMTLLADRAPVTVELALYAIVLVVLVGVPAGMLAAARRGRGADRLLTGVSTLAVSAPPFALGILLLSVLGAELGIFPVFGAGDEGWDRIWHLTLPAIALAAGQAAVVVRQTRASALNVYGKDYLTFARARGLPAGLIWGRYAVRNAALPVVTTVGLLLASGVTGAVLVEQTFSLKGLGALAVSAVGSKDIPVVQVITAIVAVAVVLGNLAVDLAQVALDPTVRKEVLG
jgi:peptide/nickel transport system permease protein